MIAAVEGCVVGPRQLAQQVQQVAQRPGGAEAPPCGARREARTGGGDLGHPQRNGMAGAPHIERLIVGHLVRPPVELNVRLRGGSDLGFQSS